jgi:hypothetical protein
MTHEEEAYQEILNTMSTHRRLQLLEHTMRKAEARIEQLERAVYKPEVLTHRVKDDTTAGTHLE